MALEHPKERDFPIPIVLIEVVARVQGPDSGDLVTFVPLSPLNVGEKH